MKIRVHTAYLGETGYAMHARGFIRNLAKHIDIRVRNYSYDSPDKVKSYINDIDKSIVDKISINVNNVLVDKDITEEYDFMNTFYDDFKQDIDIVLIEPGHIYMSQEYTSNIKIAYTVWEKTTLLESELNNLKRFNYIWVVSQWHKDILIKYGFPKNIIFIIHEGLYEDIIPNNNLDGKFKFLLFGKCEYRKSTYEIITSFSNEFKQVEYVELLLSIENKFENIDINNFLMINGLNKSNVKNVGFMERSEYVECLNSGNVFLSCARAEGWNIPLSESASIGIPVIYSNYGAQLEYIKGIGIPVNTQYNDNDEYSSPDFNDLKSKMRYVYNNYELEKSKAVINASYLNKMLSYDTIVSSTISILNDIYNQIVIDIDFRKGPYVSIRSNEEDSYKVDFIDNKNGNCLFSTNISNNSWCRCNIEYFVEWRIVITKNSINRIIYDNILNLNGKRVGIIFESSSLGDNLAWVPYLDEFRKKHNCKLIAYTHRNNLFDKQYDNIEFSDINNIDITIEHIYRVGFFYNENSINYFKHKTDPKTIPLQKTICDILDIDFLQIRPKINSVNVLQNKINKYICIAIHSTAQAKYWNNKNGWQEVVNYFINSGYDVILVSREGTDYMGNVSPYGIIDKSHCNFNEIIDYIKNGELFIGISSGLSWLAWATGVKTVLISGFSNPITEFNGKDVLRIHNNNVCNSCFNTTKLNQSDWNWCPLLKNTDRQFECSKSITGEYVIDKINKFLNTK